MNKGKIILSAVALLAVVGGALAFKAKNVRLLPPNVYTSYTTTTAPGGPIVTRCALAELAFSTTGVVGTYYTSTANNDVCVGRTITTVTVAD